MTSTTSIRVRVVRPHRPDCAGRARRAQWPSPWWLDGTAERRTKSGRATKDGVDLWLVARCLFGDTPSHPVRDACQAMAVVHAQDVADVLTNPRQLSTTPRTRSRR